MMAWTDPDAIRKLFIPVWIGLIVASLIFAGVAPPAWKRKARPFLLIGTAVLFLLFVFWMVPLRQFWLPLIAVTAITVLNYRTVRICARCGTTNRPTMLMRPPSFCSKCGAPLD